MKALLVKSPGNVELVEADNPMPGHGWARVRVHAAAICMTDFEILRGTIQSCYPLTPGHEWSGVVDAVGSESDLSWIGRRVTGDNELACLECAHCRRGEWRRCPRFKQIGFQSAGAYAEYLSIPVRNLHQIPEEVSFEQGALLEPLGVGLAVAMMSQPAPGSTAIVLGVGPIGLNCLATLKASGAIRILCFDLRKSRLEFARSWGAAAACASPEVLADAAAQFHPEGTDIVFDTTGSVEMIKLGISMTRFGGTFILAGFFRGKSTELQPDDIHLRNLRILGAGNNCGFTAVAARYATASSLKTESMITHRYRLEDYRAAFSRDTVIAPDYIKGVFIF